MFNRKHLIIPLVLFIIVSLVYAGSYYHYSEKLIKADKGGIMTAGDDGTKLDIPAGALSEDTTISMEVTSDDVSETHFTFGPHGTVFNTPVELKLSWSILKDLTSQDLILYYWDGEQWVEETTAVWDDNGKKATLYIDHFSEYYYSRR